MEQTLFYWLILSLNYLVCYTYLDFFRIICTVLGFYHTSNFPNVSDSNFVVVYTCMTLNIGPYLSYYLLQILSQYLSELIYKYTKPINLTVYIYAFILF